MGRRFPSYTHPTNMTLNHNIGVLALQGDFDKHIQSIRACGAATVLLRDPEALDAIDGLIIPGGESTTVGKLMDRFGLTAAIRRRAAGGLPIYGTCTGAIVLAKEIIGSDQPSIGAMDVAIERNAYGRQIDSFEVDVSIPAIGDEPFRAVFIRAPIIRTLGSSVETLSVCDGNVILARQGNLLVSTFHPELTDDLRVHRYFLDAICGNATVCVGR